MCFRNLILPPAPLREQTIKVKPEILNFAGFLDSYLLAL